MNTQPTWTPIPQAMPAPPRRLHDLRALRDLTTLALAAGFTGMAMAVALIATAGGDPCSPPPQVGLGTVMGIISAQLLAAGQIGLSTRRTRGVAMFLGAVGPGTVISFDLGLLTAGSPIAFAGFLIGGLLGYAVAERDLFPAHRSALWLVAGGTALAVVGWGFAVFAHTFCLTF